MLALCTSAILPLLFQLFHWECRGAPLSGHLSADGRRLAVLDKDDIVLLARSNKGLALVARIKHDNAIACSFTSDSHNVAVADANGLSIYHVDPRGKYKRSIRIDLKAAVPVSILSLKDRILIVGYSGELWMMGIEKGELIANHDLKAVAETACLSPDHKSIAIGMRNGDVVVLESMALKELVCIKAHREAVMSLVFNGDGARLTSGSMDKTVKTWKLAAPNRPESVLKTSSPVLSICLKDGNTLFLGLLDGTLALYRNGVVAAERKVAKSDLHTILYNQSIGVYTLGGDSMVRLWICLY
jgi:WD40 repeat protein